ncbi:hypothetical protein [Agromyces seonyuensis]|uniref:Uncharacterized protein n=1 Tax=Agromyces seonyuensis TaxID=2662446 RepID=A0A6I4P371_9MICO|nr:hypothetical protein [Agromyces seonyuensis]MWB98609.1 hypothetical protein [Agromyces seonyuensis]
MTNADAEPRAAAYWICWLVVLLAAGLSLVLSIVQVVNDGIGNEDALYAASRSTALLVVAAIAPLFRADEALLAIAVALTIVHGLDAYVGTTQGSVLLTVLPIGLCLATLISATFLARSDRVRGRL